MLTLRSGVLLARLGVAFGRHARCMGAKADDRGDLCVVPGHERYPVAVKPTTSVRRFVEHYADIEPGARLDGEPCRVVGATARGRAPHELITRPACRSYREQARRGQEAELPGHRAGWNAGASFVRGGILCGGARGGGRGDAEGAVQGHASGAAAGRRDRCAGR